MEYWYREANRAADLLANKRVQEANDIVILDSPPPELRSILRNDVVGVSLPRVINA